MYILTGNSILRNVEHSALLQIEPFDRASLASSYYYFGLGRHYCRFEPETNDWVTGDLSADDSGSLLVHPGEFLLIQSHERFRCSPECLGVLGASSALTRKGLSLQHSPFIDPGFPGPAETGYLELGIKNELPRAVRLTFQERIGKVSFFNVGESDLHTAIDAFHVNRQEFARRAATDKPLPLYDDDPVEGWESVEHGGES
jgi:deoxycytidine triphosphate deaminase